MKKHLSAVCFDGVTFGMDIKTDSIAYKKFKSLIKYEKVIDARGAEIKDFTVPYLFLAAIMREAHWLVSELKLFNKFTIDGLKGGNFIYAKYTDILDFRDRFGESPAKPAEREINAQI